MKRNEIRGLLCRKKDESTFILFSLFSCLFVYAYAFLRIPAIALPFSLFVTVSVTIIAALALKAKDETTTMIAVLGLLGTFYFFICPFEMPPDEPAHFMRAFEISTGRLFAKSLSSGAFGDRLPSALKDYWNRSAIIDWSDTTEIAFTTSALYSFVSYIPQSVGMLLARILTNRLAVVYYAGRLFNFLTAFALSTFALKKIPFGKKILFVIMMFPMTLQEMISLSPDAFINALSFAFVAFILDCAYGKEQVIKKDVLIIGVMLFLISLCKIVYLVAVFLVYIIPNDKLGRKDRHLLRVLVPLIAVVLNLLSLIVSMRILVNSDYTFVGSDAKTQVQFILSHPFSYMKIFAKTIFTKTESYIRTGVGGSLGWLNIDIGYIPWASLCFMLVWLSATCNDISVKIRKTDILLFVLTFFSGTVLILTSLYLQWNPPRNETIKGVQGRYFIPLLPSLFLALAYSRFGKIVVEKRKSLCLYVFVLVLNFMALVAVCKFYPDISKSEKVTASFKEDFSAIHLLFENMREYDEIQVALWSEPSGQDGLQWFTVEEANGKTQFEYNLPFEGYNTDRNYFIDVYKKIKGETKFATSTKLQIQFHLENSSEKNGEI